MKLRLTSFIVAAIVLCSCADNNDVSTTDNTATEVRIPAPVLINYQVLNRFAHDSLSFTEGLTFYNGKLYESTGAPDEPANNGTWAGTLNLQTGGFEKKVDLGTSYFGEGITFLKDKMYQITYKSKKGFVYDAKTFKKLKEFDYASEGWGLTNDGTHLIMSTGSSNLYYLDPDSLNFVKMLAVQNNNGFEGNLNELEYINGYIYANQWLTPNILKIDPATGYVVAKLDMSRITTEIKTKYSSAEEMNGIAHDSSSGKTYITGKKWPFIYQISW